MKSFLSALLIALISAIGNAMFVYGQKKSVPGNNPFIFIILALTFCIIFLSATAVMYPANSKEWFLQNIKSVIITAAGLFLTYIGFYFLYSRFGASYYILYAVLSIVSTSIIVGVVVFNEKFNLYYLISLLFAMLTIVFFFLGQKKG